MAVHDERAFAGVPTKSFTGALQLSQRILEGMAKHAKDADYPTVLDTIGLAAARTNAESVHTGAVVAKLASRKATASARAEWTRFTVLLQRMQGYLVGAYGKANPILFDYGFRPVEKRVVHRTKVGTAGGRSSRSHEAAGGTSSGASPDGASGGGGGGGGGEAGASGSSGSSSPPAATAGAGK